MIMRRVRLVFMVMVCIALGIVVWSWAGATERDLAYSGYGTIAGPLLLEWSITPAVTTPGQIVTLDVTVTNRTQLTHTPAVTLRLPAALRLAPEQSLPTGMTFNRQRNELNWLPVVSANGGIESVALTLRVETADISQPEQAITAVLRQESEERSGQALLWVGIPPQIQSVIAQSQIAVGQPVQLTADISGSGPVSQDWNLGDGRRLSVNDPLIVYPAAGIYKVTLQAANPLATVSRQANITVVPHPAAQFQVDDDNPGPGQPITFLNQSGGQPPLTYLWDFGDGVTDSSASPRHQYDALGSYQVHLVVQNEFGRSDAFWTVRVGDAPPVEMALPESVPAGQAITGQAIGDETVTTFQWDMGDGRALEGAQISHVYGRPGDYYVTLYAINDYGQSEIGRWLHVGPGQLATYLPFVRGDEMVVSQPVAVEQFDDGSGLVLEPVELEVPFIIEAVALPDNLSPAEELFFYINETRGQFGLPALNLQGTLSAVAQQHADDMLLNQYTTHIGSDGSTPPERFLLFEYEQGYAGEATAWGFEQAYEAVEFWINSPAHRRIILNRYATDVGVAFSMDYAAPNVWYWTAEFGNSFAAPELPDLRLQRPLPYSPPSEDEVAAEMLISDAVVYSWNWPRPLAADEQFIIYLYGAGGSVPLQRVQQPSHHTLYSVAVPAYPVVRQAGVYEWQVRLEKVNGEVMAASERRPIFLAADPNLIPTVTPVPTLTATLLPTVTPTSTPTSIWPTPTELPPIPTQPVLPIATPVAEP